MEVILNEIKGKIINIKGVNLLIRVRSLKNKENIQISTNSKNQLKGAKESVNTISYLQRFKTIKSIINFAVFVKLNVVNLEKYSNIKRISKKYPNITCKISHWNKKGNSDIRLQLGYNKEYHQQILNFIKEITFYKDIQWLSEEKVWNINHEKVYELAYCVNYLGNRNIYN